MSRRQNIPLQRDAVALTNFKAEAERSTKGVLYAWVPMSILRRAKRVAAAVTRAPKPSKGKTQ